MERSIVGASAVLGDGIGAGAVVPFARLNKRREVKVDGAEGDDECEEEDDEDDEDDGEYKDEGDAPKPKAAKTPTKPRDDPVSDETGSELEAVEAHQRLRCDDEDEADEEEEESEVAEEEEDDGEETPKLPRHPPSRATTLSPTRPTQSSKQSSRTRTPPRSAIRTRSSGRCRRSPPPPTQTATRARARRTSDYYACGLGDDASDLELSEASSLSGSLSSSGSSSLMSARKPKSAAEILASQAAVVSWAIPETPIRLVVNRDRPDSGSPSPFPAAATLQIRYTHSQCPSLSRAVFPFTFHQSACHIERPVTSLLARRAILRREWRARGRRRGGGAALYQDDVVEEADIRA
ncbi:hypothetical protein HWV62_17555 [Athelia sp. TMB]|nr:hypothetical protein HWV62_17555 [Athelia sp. TMB]